MKKMNIIIFGLSITSSWGNGHATTYRSLIKALANRGHTITFLEKNVSWYAAHRDMPTPDFCTTLLYQDVSDLDAHHTLFNSADLIILGSYVADALAIHEKILRLEPPCFAFYDIDTPVTLAKLARGDYEYLLPSMIPQFDLYLSFSGGPVLQTLEQQYGARRARPLYCSVDPDLYKPVTPSADSKDVTPAFALGYLGTYSNDRQPRVNELLLEPARRCQDVPFVVAGAQYPQDIDWPPNVTYLEHVPPHEHCQFYHNQRFTLNVTRDDMIAAGYSPSVRLFEAGACGVPIISDYWEGLNNFFSIGEEILVADSAQDVIRHLQMPTSQRQAMGQRLRKKVMAHHTSAHRAVSLENYWGEVVAPMMLVSG